MRQRVWDVLSKDWQITQARPDVAAQPLPPSAQWVQQQLAQDELPHTFDEGFAAGRIWLGFMTMRIMVALLVLGLHVLTLWLDYGSQRAWLLPLAMAYLAVTVATRLWVAPVRLGQAFEVHWLYTAGLDLAFYAVVLWFGQTATVSYLPLMALPPLVCAALGTWRLALVTALLCAGLLGAYYGGDVTWGSRQSLLLFAQLGAFVLAMLLLSYALHRLSSSLDVQHIEVLGSQKLARLRGRINDLVVQSVHDGLIVVGASGRIRAINPAAHSMLRLRIPRHDIPGQLMQSLLPMQPLLHLAQQSLQEGEGVSAEVFGLGAGSGRAPHLMVRTQVDLPDGQYPDEERLCLLYLQDMQELQQQVRTEKLAAMGRMSASVAHEIRNPLAAVAQAAQLLDEELESPLQKKLGGMVQTNVRRLERIVTDILDIASLQREPRIAEPLELDAELADICADWRRINAEAGTQLAISLDAPGSQVCFDAEHLRRIIINLLDNALRYGGGGSIILRSASDGRVAVAQVWSAGEPLSPEVQAHLFEPFASGHSRSTGLGLYICRELAERYHAQMCYSRTTADAIMLPEDMGDELGLGQALDSLDSMGSADHADGQPGRRDGNLFYLGMTLVKATSARRQARAEGSYPALSPDGRPEYDHTPSGFPITQLHSVY